MRWLRIVVFILVVTILQASKWLDLIALTNLNIKPDLLLILLVFFVINCTTYEVIIMSFVLGFMADIVGGVMGTHMISFGVFGILLRYTHNMIMIRKTFHQAIAIFLTCLLSGVLVQLLVALKGRVSGFSMPAVLLGTSFYSAVIGPYICSLLLTAAKWFGIKKYRFSTPAGR